MKSTTTSTAAGLTLGAGIGGLNAAVIDPSLPVSVQIVAILAPILAPLVQAAVQKLLER